MKDNLVVTPGQMKMLEEESDKAGVSYEKMMENAGHALALNLKEIVDNQFKESWMTSPPRVIFLCGTGNNGGDCFVAARYLKEMEVTSLIFLLGKEPKSVLAKINFDRLEDVKVVTNEEEMERILEENYYDIKADGVFGTGFHGQLPDNVKRIFSKCRGYIVGVDVPSGGNCQTGAAADGILNTDITITFGAIKFGMVQYPLRCFCENIKTVSIDIPDSVYEKIDYPIRLMDSNLVKEAFPKRKAYSHKGDYGKLLNVCGSLKMPGASLMAAMAAERCGVGLVTVCTLKEYIPHFAAKIPEGVFLPLETCEEGTYSISSYHKIIEASSKSTAVLIGCGMGVSPDSCELVKKLLLNITNCPIILDADGINCIADSIDIIRQTKSKVILTPHPAEMARLCKVTTAQIQSDRLGYAQTFAKENECTVVLKGAGTVIADKSCAYVSLTGNPGMSRGGSGDVLAGIIGALTAWGVNPQSGVYIHGAAGDKAAKKYTETAMLPTDVISELGEVFKDIGI